MKRSRMTRRAVLTAGTSIRRNKGGFVAAAASIAVALTMTGIALLLQLQVGLAKGSWYDKAGITAYFCTDSSADNECRGEPNQTQMEDLAARVREVPGVEAVYIETPDQAWQAFNTQFAGTEILRSVTADAIPGSLRIKAEREAVKEDLVRTLNGYNEIEKAVDQQELLSGFFRAVTGLQLAAGIFAATQGAATIALVGNLVRTALRQRRNEVRIMDLVGAPNRMVRAPFVLESVAVCFLGAGISVLALTFGVNELLPRILPASDILVVGVQHVAVTGGWLTFAAVMLGWLVSRVVLRHGAREDQD